MEGVGERDEFHEGCRLSAFNRESWQFIVGQLGEKAAAREFKRDRMSVIASCEFSGKNDNHAPVLEFERHNLTLPDLDVSGRGKRCWFEVKTYDAPQLFRVHGCYVHGIPVRLFDHYVNVERETGSEVYLAIVEVATSEMLVGSVPLSQMSKYPCLCRGGCRSVDRDKHTASNDNGIREPQWYFDRDDFETRYQIDKRTIEQIRSKRGHALRRHGLDRETVASPAPAEYPLPPCADCGKTTTVMFTMHPGRDGQPWRLCSRCWRSSVEDKATP